MTQPDTLHTRRVCDVAGCEKFCNPGCRWCGMHTSRMRKTGELGPPGTIVPTHEQRFWAKVTKTDSCWVWTGRVDHKGYGRVHFGNTLLAHRFSYELHVGQIPADRFVLHSCDNPPCVNPEHLRLGSIADNSLDMMRRDRHPRTIPKDVVRMVVAMREAGEPYSAIIAATGHKRGTLHALVYRYRKQAAAGINAWRWEADRGE